MDKKAKLGVQKIENTKLYQFPEARSKRKVNQQNTSGEIKRLGRTDSKAHMNTTKGPGGRRIAPAPEGPHESRKQASPIPRSHVQSSKVSYTSDNKKINRAFKDIVKVKENKNGQYRGHRTTRIASNMDTVARELHKITNLSAREKAKEEFIQALVAKGLFKEEEIAGFRKKLDKVPEEQTIPQGFKLLETPKMQARREAEEANDREGAADIITNYLATDRNIKAGKYSQKFKSLEEKIKGATKDDRNGIEEGSIATEILHILNRINEEVKAEGLGDEKSITEHIVNDILMKIQVPHNVTIGEELAAFLGRIGMSDNLTTIDNLIERLSRDPVDDVKSEEIHISAEEIKQSTINGYFDQLANKLKEGLEGLDINSYQEGNLTNILIDGLNAIENTILGKDVKPYIKGIKAALEEILDSSNVIDATKTSPALRKEVSNLHQMLEKFDKVPSRSNVSVLIGILIGFDHYGAGFEEE